MFQIHLKLTLRSAAAIVSILAACSPSASEDSEVYYNSNPSWSPDGAEILYYSTRTGENQLYRMNADGSNQRPVKPSENSDSYPVMSPDSEEIVFSSKRGDAKGDLFVINTNDLSERQLTYAPGSEGFPMWSRDGEWLAYEAKRNEEESDIYIISRDGADERRVTSDPAPDYHPSWSAEGDFLSFHSKRSGEYQIWVANIDGSNPRQLTNGERQAGTANISPDGRRMVYVVYMSDDESDIFVSDIEMEPEIHLENAVQLTNEPGPDYGPIWSPDGAHIAFMSNRAGAQDIFVMNADGGDVKKLTNGSEGLR